MSQWGTFATHPSTQTVPVISIVDLEWEITGGTGASPGLRARARQSPLVT